MKTIITTVGTSLFTNAFRGNAPKCYNRIKDKPYREWKNCQADITETKKYFCDLIQNNSTNASAEIKSLVQMQKELNKKIIVIMITTDTVLSNLAAEILKDYFSNSQEIKIDPVIRRIENLQVNDPELFENSGMSNLSKEIYKIIDTNKPDNCILNITGGFKGVIPYLTIIGQIKNIPIGYIFENSSSVIVIPQIPIQFDYTVAEEYYYSLIDAKQGRFVDKKILSDLFKMKLINKKNKPTGIGDFFMDYVESETVISNNIFGFYIESKFFEYFSRKYGNEYKVLHSVKDPDFNSKEIDFIIQKSDSFISVEIKSLLSNTARNAKLLDGSYGTGIDKIKEQILNQLESYKNLNKIPAEYHYYIYSISKPNEHQQKKIYEELSSIFMNYTAIKFKMFYLLIRRNPLNNYFQNILAKFMSSPINEKDISEFTII